MDARIQTQRYAIIIQKSIYYDKVKSDFNDTNDFLESNIVNAYEHAENLIQIHERSANQYFNDILTMVKDDFKIDRLPLNIEQRIVDPKVDGQDLKVREFKLTDYEWRDKKSVSKQAAADGQS